MSARGRVRIHNWIHQTVPRDDIYLQGQSFSIFLPFSFHPFRAFTDSLLFSGSMNSASLSFYRAMVRPLSNEMSAIDGQCGLGSSYHPALTIIYRYRKISTFASYCSFPPQLSAAPFCDIDWPALIVRKTIRTNPLLNQTKMGHWRRWNRSC